MSMLPCSNCSELVDTDLDPEGFYPVEGQFWCKRCRESRGWPPEVELQLLESELAKVEAQRYGLEMGDDLCYSSGRIEPILQAERELWGKIEDLRRQV